MSDRSDIPIRFRAVLYAGPAISWRERYWSESARQWNHIRPDTALADRPEATFEAGLDATLISILLAACDVWGLLPGPAMEGTGDERWIQLVRYAFVEEDADRDGISEQTGYQWPHQLPAPHADGTISLVSGRDITVRQLLAAAQLGLISGDVTRPYVYPVAPQGAGQVITDLTNIAPEVVREVLATIKGLDGHLVKLVSLSASELHKADRYVSEHPIETAAGVTIARGPLKRLADRVRKRLKDSDGE